RHFRRIAAGRDKAPRGADQLDEPCPRRRLDSHRPAGHHRGRGAFRTPRGGMCERRAEQMTDTSTSLKERPVHARSLDHSIEAATAALLDLQKDDGHWVFELEADATVPAEYVLLRHYLGEPVDTALESKIAAYLR